MGLILDSSVLIGAERKAQTDSSLLRSIKETTGETVLAISAVSVIELEHGFWRADTPERAAQRRIYLHEVCVTRFRYVYRVPSGGKAPRE